MQKNASLKGEDLAKAVDQQPWDESVKALTQFPAVLDNMSNNLSGLRRWAMHISTSSRT